jgi:hypothetical protein
MMIGKPAPMKATEMISHLAYLVSHFGDCEVFFADGFSYFGAGIHTESAPNFDMPNKFLIKAFNLETGKKEPSVPLNYGSAIKAWNSHDQLVAALRETMKAAAGYLDDEHGIPPDGKEWYERAKAALALAGAA